MRRGAEQDHSDGRAHAGRFRLVSGLDGRRRAAGQPGRQRSRCRRTHPPQPAADAAPAGCPPRPSSRLAGALRSLVRRRPDTSKCSSTLSSGAPTSKPFCSPRSAPSCRCAVSHPRRFRSPSPALKVKRSSTWSTRRRSTCVMRTIARGRRAPSRTTSWLPGCGSVSRCFLETWVLRGAGAPGWRPGAGAPCRALRSSRAARRAIRRRVRARARSGRSGCATAGCRPSAAASLQM